MTKRVKVTLKSETDLLMHADNIGFSDEMDRWKSDPKNKAASKPGDDRTPARRPPERTAARYREWTTCFSNLSTRPHGRRII